jgi:hypothetical protein
VQRADLVDKLILGQIFYEQDGMPTLNGAMVKLIPPGWKQVFRGIFLDKDSSA